MVVSELIAGIYLPIFTAVWAAIYLLARIGYQFGYKRSVQARNGFVPIMGVT